MPIGQLSSIRRRHPLRPRDELSPLVLTGSAERPRAIVFLTKPVLISLWDQHRVRVPRDWLIAAAYEPSACHIREIHRLARSYESSILFVGDVNVQALRSYVLLRAPGGSVVPQVAPVTWLGIDESWLALRRDYNGSPVHLAGARERRQARALLKAVPWLVDEIPPCVVDYVRTGHVLHVEAAARATKMSDQPAYTRRLMGLLRRRVRAAMSRDKG